MLDMMGCIRREEEGRGTFDLDEGIVGVDGNDELGRRERKGGEMPRASWRSETRQP